MDDLMSAVLRSALTADQIATAAAAGAAADRNTYRVSGLRADLARTRAALVEACGAIEAHARMCFVVCGQPAEQAGFERAWLDEDPDDYRRWLRLRAAAWLPKTSHELACETSVRLSFLSHNWEPIYD